MYRDLFRFPYIRLFIRTPDLEGDVLIIYKKFRITIELQPFKQNDVFF